jgi:F-type H+-transporting ATPase subunit a
LATPLEQFKVKPLIDAPLTLHGYDIYLTNSTIYMVLAVALTLLIFKLGMGKGKLVPGRMQSFVESTYELIEGMIKGNAGDEGLKYFPLIFSIFVFILFGNLLGLIPYAGFTFTSHIIVTFCLALTVFVIVTLIAIFKHGFKFLTFFVPEGAPKILLPLIIPIEIISYLSRPISLSVRLFANMTAGHIMLKVFAGFVLAMGVFGFLPVLFDMLLIGFEVGIAILQAYVFTLLTCIYLNDALHLH